MSAPTAESAVHLGPAAFAAAVRAQLADLPPDVVEDLTDGLEADLAETAAERGSEDLVAVLGSPLAYATELRASAGLPPADARGRLSSGVSRAALAAWWAAKDREWQRHSWWAPVRDAVISLRPAWWIARAILVTFVLTVVPGTVSSVGWLLGFGLMVASVALGRGWLRDHRGGLLLVTAANILGVFIIPFFIAWAYNAVWSPRYIETPITAYTAPRVLTNEGSDVTNIFAYDAAGKPIPVVQLFDQDGRPLALSPEMAESHSGSLQQNLTTPYRDAQDYSSPTWNAFPIWNAVQDPNGIPDPTPPAPPFVSVPRIVPPPSTGGTPSLPAWPVPDPSASDTASSSATPSVTPSATTAPRPSSSTPASPAPTRTSR